MGAKVHFQAHAHLTLKETRVSQWVGKMKLLPRVKRDCRGWGRLPWREPCPLDKKERSRPRTRRGKAVT